MRGAAAYPDAESGGILPVARFAAANLANPDLAKYPRADQVAPANHDKGGAMVKRTRKKQAAQPNGDGARGTQDAPFKPAIAAFEPVDEQQAHDDEEDLLVWSHLGSRKPKPKEYLWAPRIALGSVTVLQGKKTAGKSLFCGALVAHTTGGPALPGSSRRQPRSVLWLTIEMDYEGDVQPLVVCCEGEVTRVFPLPEHKETGERVRLTLPDDADLLLKICLERDVALIIIDPISDFVSPSCDIMGQQGARAWMRCLTEICRRANAAGLVIQHLVKSSRGLAIDQGQGHADIVNTARMVMRAQCLVKDQLHVLAVVATNGGKAAPTLEFSPEVIGENARVKWGKISELTAEQLASEDTDAGERDAREDARHLLRTALANREVPAKELDKLAEDAKVTMHTLRKAKVDIGAKSKQRKRDGKPQWVWYLPGKAQKEPKK